MWCLSWAQVSKPCSRAKTNWAPASVGSGVCGGFAEWLGWDVTLVRTAYVAVSICSAAFPGILVYLVLWILMPQSD